MPLSQDGINVDCALVGQIYTTAAPDAVVHKADEAGYFEEGVRVLLK